MNGQTGRDRLIRALDDRAASGRPASLWLRDDDAVEPTHALGRFLAITQGHAVPVTLAVIPEETGVALEAYLAVRPLVSVALHGWSHRNYAPSTEKKQELGPHRPAALVLAELASGMSKLSALYGDVLLPLLVPPWNRISPALLPQLAGIGIGWLSVFGPEKARGIPEMNTHVDVMDWHGTRGGRPLDVLFGEIAARIETMGEGAAMGLLTHHLVHDAAVESFLEALFALTSGHAGCRWVPAADLLRA